MPRTGSAPCPPALRLGLAGLLIGLGAACVPEVPEHLRVAGGHADTGRELIARYGCSACHRIPGVRVVHGSVGPDLRGFGRRAYLAGRWPNRPALLTRWLLDPTALDPQTAMPAQGLSEAQARHMAAYLYTLR